MQTNYEHIKIYTLLALCVLFWSANFILGRYLHDALSPITLAFYRWMGVFFCILPFLIKEFKPIMQALKKDFIYLSILSILSVSCFNTFLYIGLQDTMATNALLINSVFPILVLVLAFIILKDKISRYQLLGIASSTVGVVFIVLQGDFQKISTFELNRGDLFVMLASLSWAMYSVLLRYKKITLNPLQFLTTTVTIGLIVLSPFYFIFTENFAYDWVEVKLHWHFIAFIIIFPSILSFLFWNHGILEIGAEKTGQFTHLMPIFGAILAFIFLNEMPKFYHLLGVVFIFSGIYFSLFLKRKR